MALTFDSGSPDHARGHALLYYRAGSSLAATYAVVLPITVDFAKYVPPIFANQIKQTNLDQLAAFAMPPAPEAVSSYEFLERLASSRGDDLVFGGDIPDNDFVEAAQRVNDNVQEYAELYQRHAVAPPSPDESGASGEAISDLDVKDIMYSLMSENDRLRELSKLVGALRFAAEGADRSLMAEAEAEMQAIARHLPEGFQVALLIEAGKKPGSNNARLAQLYLERCYKLADADYAAAAALESAIQELRKGFSST